MKPRQERNEAILVARRTTRTKSPAAIVELLDSDEAVVRFHAVNAIGRQRLIEGAPALVRRLPMEQGELKEAIVGVLATLAEPSTRETFHALLDDPSPTVRRLALRGLAALGDPATIEIATEFY